MQLTAACAFGLEAIVKRELIALGFTPQVSQPGRVSFEGDWSAVCRANTWLRTADRVLVEVQKFDAPDFDALFDTIKEFDWSQFVPVDAQFPVIGRSRLSTLTSVPAVQRSVKRAVVESLKKHHDTESLPETGALYKIEVALLQDVATLTIDTTGPSLHKRGYRKLVGDAPIKETLAAALVDLSVWNKERALLDPFCGSGTIPIEAALAGLKMAPGINRSFACSDWPEIEEQLWTDVVTQAKDESLKDFELQILGFDINPEVLSLARYHAQQAGVEDHIHFQQRSFSDLRNKREYGCVVTNPPYGERLSEHEALMPLYESMPAVLQRLPTWSHFILTSMPKFERIVQRRATRRRKLFNGRIECTYYQFLGPRPPRPGETQATPDQVEATASTSTPTTDLTKEVVHDQAPPIDASATPQSVPSELPTPNSAPTATTASETSNVATDVDLTANSGADTTAPPPTVLPANVAKESTTESSETFKAPKERVILPVFGGVLPKDREQAELFGIRLAKRAKHLRKWPKRGITCYRIYERDIPELPFVVDRYEEFLHITEYERPHERDLARHSAWLELMTQTASTTLDIPIQNVFLKRRRKTSSQTDGKTQYSKVNNQGKLFEVNEGGLKFYANLSDYVDTGLFLDHRQTREMVRREARGKRFLNLFAYTGSFSVYAADGGATATTTVDLSKNYVDWSTRNMKLNGFSGPAHQYVVQDAMKFITQSQTHPVKFDLAVVDPPTFSNSKRTEVDWNVQHQHAQLLESLKDCLTNEAIVYFSNNFRTFKLDEERLSKHYRIIEITKQTIPEDFRNKRIHRCWKLFAT